VETQFRPEAEFSDDALRFSNIPAKVDDDVTSVASVDAQAEASDIADITNKTANLSVDSPAMNTRRRSVLKGSVDSPNVSRRSIVIPPPPQNSKGVRKRRSVSSSSTVRFVEIVHTWKKNLNFLSDKKNVPLPFHLSCLIVGSSVR
jgi:hypothetical protein